MATPTPKSSRRQRGEPQANPRVVIAAVSVIGLAAVILGFFRILNDIRQPFAPNLKSEQSQNTSLAIQQDDKLKRQDTDGDGLNDYDELYLYNTSPFLKDSDSDGVDDKTEISRGTDPNCPEGKACGLALASTNTNGAISNTNGLVNTNATSATATDAATIRQTLIDAGAPAYLLNATDDKTLLELYQNAIAQSGTNTNADASVSIPPTNSSLPNANTTSETDVSATLQSLSPTEMRDLLKSSGADAKLLDQVDDATLQKIFLQAVNEQTATTTNTNASP